MCCAPRHPHVLGAKDVSNPEYRYLTPVSYYYDWFRPRLRKYSVLSEADPLWAPCVAGAAGDEAQARRCMAGWEVRVPRFRFQVEQVRQALWETFPNETPDGKVHRLWSRNLTDRPTFSVL